MCYLDGVHLDTRASAAARGSLGLGVMGQLGHAGASAQCIECPPVYRDTCTGTAMYACTVQYSGSCSLKKLIRKETRAQTVQNMSLSRVKDLIAHCQECGTMHCYPDVLACLVGKLPVCMRVKRNRRHAYLLHACMLIA